jgi:hypothetical protein
VLIQTKLIDVAGRWEQVRTGEKIEYMTDRVEKAQDGMIWCELTHQVDHKHLRHATPDEISAYRAEREYSAQYTADMFGAGQLSTLSEPEYI